MIIDRMKLNVQDDKIKLFTISNLLSFLRLLLGVCLYYSILQQHSVIAIIIAVIAIITDYADGYFARKRNEISEIGKILDPLADKVAVGLGSIALYQTYGLPLWMLIIILGRDALIVLGSLFLIPRIRRVKGSEIPGKIAVSVIALLLLSYLFNINILKIPLLYITLIVIIISFSYYVIKFIKLIRKSHIQ